MSLRLRRLLIFKVNCLRTNHLVFLLGRYNEFLSRGVSIRKRHIWVAFILPRTHWKREVKNVQKQKLLQQLSLQTCLDTILTNTLTNSTYQIFCRVSDTEEIHNQGSRQELPDEKDHSEHYVTCISQLTFQICLLKSRREKCLKKQRRHLI